MRQPEGLIQVLMDREATLAERDDAAMDLQAFDEPEVLSVLLRVAADADEPELIQASCGEAIGAIWMRQGSFDPIALASLAPAAQSEIRGRFG